MALNPNREVSTLDADFRKLSWFAGGVICCALAAAWTATPLGAAEPAADAGGPGQTLVCLDCHDGLAASLSAGPHRVLMGAANDVATRVSCTSCHGGQPAHWLDDPSANPMTNPARQTAKEVAAACATCHQGAHQVNQQTLSAHAAADVACTACHRVHGGTQRGQLQQAQSELCFGCHTGVRGQFAQPSHHPLENGLVSCTDCHLSGDDGMAGATRRDVNATCGKCHAALRGPFPHEHAATLDYSVEDGGCLNCHDPHGSPLPRLLKQPYTAPHFQLCSQCHTVPGHQFNSFHGNEWAGVACSECHVDIHGSYTNRDLLTPALQPRGCFAAGCHGGQ
jgi:DmsE family decaheme c-type cytochrome